MGFNKENYRRIRAEFETKTFRAQEEADARRAELYTQIPAVREMDTQLSQFGLRIMKCALENKDMAGQIEKLHAENERILRERGALLKRHGYPEDYSEPKYECEKCKDTGYVDIKMCDCMRHALIEAGMRSSGLSMLITKQSFDNFSLDYYKDSPKDRSMMESHYRNLRYYAETFALDAAHPIPRNLLLFGGTGLGKTHLSTAIARVVIEKGYDVYYNSAVGMISDFEYRRFGNAIASDGGDDTSKYTECDLLIIDDLGTEVVNQFTLSCLYHVINTRINLQKPMIINTNLLSADIRKIYTDRLSSRLLGEFLQVPFFGTDVRSQRLKT